MPKKAPQPVNLKKKDNLTVHLDSSIPRDTSAQALINRPGSGPHKNREKDVAEGRSRKPKHPRRWLDKEAHMDELIGRIVSRHSKETA